MGRVSAWDPWRAGSDTSPATTLPEQPWGCGAGAAQAEPGTFPRELAEAVRPVTPAGATRSRSS